MVKRGCKVVDEGFCRFPYGRNNRPCKKHLIFRNLTAEDVEAIIDRPQIPNIYHV